MLQPSELTPALASPSEGESLLQNGISPEREDRPRRGPGATSTAALASSTSPFAASASCTSTRVASIGCDR